MRVLVADDHPQVRSALGLLLEYEPQLQVVGEVAYAEDLLQQLHKTKPDLLLLDWELPGLPAVDLIKAVRAASPDLFIVALSGRPEAYQDALLAGVDEFISKGHPPEQVLAILRAFNDRYLKKIHKERVEAWMTRAVVTISPEAMLQEADTLMTDQTVRRLPVVSEGRLVGIITKNDIREAKLSANAPLSIWQFNYLLATTKVKDLMTRTPVTIPEKATLSQAAQIMRSHKISGLPVISSKGAVVGFITESDIFRAVVEKWSDS